MQIAPLPSEPQEGGLNSRGIPEVHAPQDPPEPRGEGLLGVMRGELDRPIERGDDPHRHRHVVHRFRRTAHGLNPQSSREGFGVRSDSHVCGDRRHRRESHDRSEKGCRSLGRDRHPEGDASEKGGRDGGEGSESEDLIERDVEAGVFQGPVEIRLLYRPAGTLLCALQARDLS